MGVHERPSRLPGPAGSRRRSRPARSRGRRCRGRRCCRRSDAPRSAGAGAGVPLAPGSPICCPAVTACPRETSRFCRWAHQVGQLTGSCRCLDQPPPRHPWLVSICTVAAVGSQGRGAAGVREIGAGVSGGPVAGGPAPIAAVVACQVRRPREHPGGRAGGGGSEGAAGQRGRRRVHKSVARRVGPHRVELPDVVVVVVVVVGVGRALHPLGGHRQRQRLQPGTCSSVS